MYRHHQGKGLAMSFSAIILLLLLLLIPAIGFGALEIRGFSEYLFRPAI